MTDYDDEFLNIANGLVVEDFNHSLDVQMEQVRRWANERIRNGQRMDLKTLVDTTFESPPPYNVAICLLATAVWRLCEIEAEKEHDQRH